MSWLEVSNSKAGKSAFEGSVPKRYINGRTQYDLIVELQECKLFESGNPKTEGDTCFVATLTVEENGNPDAVDVDGNPFEAGDTIEYFCNLSRKGKGQKFQVKEAIDFACGITGVDPRLGRIEKAEALEDEMADEEVLKGRRYRLVSTPRDKGEYFNHEMIPLDEESAISGQPA